MAHSHDCRIFLALVINPVKGRWFDLTSEQDVDDAYEAIQALADADPESGGEIAVADCEGPIRLDRLSIDDMKEAAEWLNGDGERYPTSLIAAAYANDPTRYQEVCEQACGPYRNLRIVVGVVEEWAEQLADDLGYSGSDHPLASYIDYERWGRDLLRGGDYYELETDEGSYFVPNC